MKYYVWIEYYCASPVSKNVKSDELKYHTGHEHGVQPLQTQVDSLQSSLTAAVQAAYAKYNKTPGNTAQTAPTNAAITLARAVKTRSEK